MRLIKLFCLLILQGGILFQASGQGLILNDAHYTNFPSQYISDGSKNVSSLSLDSIFQSSLKEFCPIPKDQRNDANCVGWAVGYAAQSIRNNFVQSIKDKAIIDRTAFSPHFIYNQVKLKDCKLGAEIIDAMSLLLTSGNVFFDDFSQGISDCYAQPDQELFKIAHENRIQDFIKLFDPNSHRQEKINSVKLALVDGFPVVIALEVIESFFNLESGENIWYSELGSQVPVGGHALTVIGFDETLKSFEVMNSWGPAWANDGFAWIDYNDFAKYAKYGFCFLDNNEENYAVQINFRRKVLITSDENIHFAEELFKYKDLHYTPVNDFAKKGSIYQFQFFNSRKDYNIYCINRGNSSAYNLLMEVNGENYNDFGFILPGEDTGIELTDDVCEEFIFLITRSRLAIDWSKTLNACNSFEELEAVIQAYVTINKETRHSYNRVGFISELKNKEAVLLRVVFNLKQD